MIVKLRDAHLLRWLFLGGLFMLSLGISGCGSSATSPPSIATVVSTPTAAVERTPTAAVERTSTAAPIVARPAAPTPTPAPTDTPQPTPAPTDTPRPTPASLILTIVHTNDTWGYLEPCG